MIQLFAFDHHKINTADYTHALHGEQVYILEREFAEYVGAKYACSICSATNAIFLIFRGTGAAVHIPSVIPPVVINAVVNADCDVQLTDQTDWVGHSYILHNFGTHKIIDSAQRVDKGQFAEVNNNDLMFFSFYPTKPVSGLDGGMVVSNNEAAIEALREATYNGMQMARNNWDRRIKSIGWKMYLNSVQADVALRNLRTLEVRKSRLREIRDKYNSMLGLNNASDHLYRLTVDNNVEFLKWMTSNDITCGIHYRAAHLCDIYSGYATAPLPQAELVSTTTVSIPFHHQLTDAEVDLICRKTQEYCNVHQISKLGNATDSQRLLGG